MIDMDSQEGNLLDCELWHAIDLDTAIRDQTTGIFLDIFTQLSSRVGNCLC